MTVPLPAMRLVLLEDRTEQLDWRIARLRDESPRRALVRRRGPLYCTRRAEQQRRRSGKRSPISRGNLRAAGADPHVQRFQVLWALGRLEARGLIRGGHFVITVTGEQFADEETLPMLRPRGAASVAGSGVAQ